MEIQAGRKVTVTAVISAILLASSCSTDSEPKKNSGTPTREVLLKPLSEACEGLFDKKAASEIRNKGHLARVDVMRDDLLFFLSGASILNRRMNPEERAIPCEMNDETGTKRLLELKFSWGPVEFPKESRKAGRTAVWVLPKNHQSIAQLIVDCQRPDLAAKRKNREPLALNVALNEHLGLSTTTRKRILTAGTKKFLVRLECDNRIVLPDPDDKS
ncbi:hypothetical protein IHE55_22045 [Streptomyces pactum]|uniref:Lipoprotein n=1 Tax=Streptomyces pactum TaxID=68249 RepID=A0ABS0NQ15_9ACTN|nr:hypothetical protein [Streptomyces pactum]MBH5337295.1 hypothetical protein [Streptomyces pactum]